MRSRPPSVKPAARPDPPGVVEQLVVTVASGSPPEGPDGSGVNGLTPGPLRLLGRRCRQAKGLPQVTRAYLSLNSPRKSVYRAQEEGRLCQTEDSLTAPDWWIPDVVVAVGTRRGRRAVEVRLHPAIRTIETMTRHGGDYAIWSKLVCRARLG